MGVLSNCGTCIHWIPQRKQGGAITVGENTPGECHCNPPTPQMVAVGPGAFQPFTMFPAPHSNMWCGQHKLSK